MLSASDLFVNYVNIMFIQLLSPNLFMKYNSLSHQNIIYFIEKKNNKTQLGLEDNVKKILKM